MFNDNLTNNTPFFPLLRVLLPSLIPTAPAKPPYSNFAPFARKFADKSRRRRLRRDFSWKISRQGRQGAKNAKGRKKVVVRPIIRDISRFIMFNDNLTNNTPFFPLLRVLLPSLIPTAHAKPPYSNFAFFAPLRPLRENLQKSRAAGAGAFGATSRGRSHAKDAKAQRTPRKKSLNH